MASYYYLISSLPDLRSDGEMPMSYEQFLTMCESNVSEKTYGLLKDLKLSSEEGPLVSDWAVSYGMLTKEVNYQRSINLGRAYSSAFDKDPEIGRVAAAALSAKNPLDAEQILLDYEFELLDSLVGLHSFDDHVLFGYAIKLKLLERKSCFRTDKGKKEFKRLFDQLQERVYSL